MFRPNETHRQQDLFGLQTQLAPELWQRLQASEEFAFYSEIFCRIPEAHFADLYSAEPATRPNAPINVLVGALILQHLHNWTVEELLDRLAFDLKVRASLGLWSLSEAPFCRATWFNFQRKLRDHLVQSGQDKFQALFDRLTVEQLARFGLETSIQRCDSTQLGSNLRQYTRIELLVEVVLRLWRLLDEADQAAYAERFAPFVRARTAGQFLYRLRTSEIEPTLVQLGQLYAWMVEALEADYGEREIYRIVCRVFAEHFCRVEEQIEVRAAEEIGSGSLQSPDDLEATYRKKEEEHYRGYVLHATETAHPENPLQLVTDVVVVPNHEDDSRILQARLEAMKQKTPDLEELHHDAAYGSEPNDRLQAELGIEAVQSGIRGRVAEAPIQIEALPEVPGCYRLSCAAGQKVESAPTRTRFKAVFAASACQGCPFAAQCPAQKRADGGRTFYFTEADALRQARHRRLQELPGERQRLRANVEATMKQFKAPLRGGKLRTRGRAAAARYGYLRAIGINFGRIYRYTCAHSEDVGESAASRPRRGTAEALPRVLFWHRGLRGLRCGSLSARPGSPAAIAPAWAA
jgi:hypothetical protein